MRLGLDWYILKPVIGWVERRKNMWHPATHTAQMVWDVPKLTLYSVERGNIRNY